MGGAGSGYGAFLLVCLKSSMIADDMHAVFDAGEEAVRSAILEQIGNESSFRHGSWVGTLMTDPAGKGKAWELKDILSLRWINWDPKFKFYFRWLTRGDFASEWPSQPIGLLGALNRSICPRVQIE